MTLAGFLADHWLSVAGGLAGGAAAFTLARLTSPTRRTRRRAGAMAAAHRANTTCTGLTATWCPVHGDCACPELEGVWGSDGRSMSDPACPLHAITSDHAEKRGTPC